MSKIGRSQGEDKAAFGSRRNCKEFAEAILACEDDEQVDARQVILAASSPFFQGLLKRYKHTHPLVYRRRVESILHRLLERLNVIDNAVEDGAGHF